MTGTYLITTSFFVIFVLYLSLPVYKKIVLCHVHIFFNKYLVSTVIIENDLTCIYIKKKFENAKGVARNCKSKDRQHNGQ